MSVIGAITIIKLVGIAASSYGSWEAWQAMPGGKARRRLNDLFRNGDLALQLRRQRGGKQEIVRKYPKVKEVRVYDDKTTIVFTIPEGLDPAEVWKKEYLLKQGFGPYVELTEKYSKVFIAEVYEKDIEKFAYSLDTVAAQVTGLKVPIYVGMGRRGHVVYDAVTHPHLLIAGETGSGKSVMLRNVLTTLIMTAGDRVLLHCIDLKRSEFHLFRGAAESVDTEPVAAAQTLYKLQKEMTRRGKILEAHEVEHVDELPGDARLPYIVLAIDEVSILADEKPLMAIVERISSIGRAYGMFLILAMQRPDKDVLDGKLKVNLSVRMAFRLPDDVNSRIALGSGEAAAIRRDQSGRMALSLSGIQYVQSPLLELKDAKALLAPRKAVKVGTGSARKPAPDAPVIETEEVAAGLWGVLDDDGEG
jgi:S-DNA-T family DNA segregation ATPase FtsK/SpoIIIE